MSKSTFQTKSAIKYITTHSLTHCLFDRTQHVVGVQTVTKAEFRSSQTHEFEALRKLLPAVQAKG